MAHSPAVQSYIISKNKHTLSFLWTEIFICLKQISQLLIYVGLCQQSAYSILNANYISAYPREHSIRTICRVEPDNLLIITTRRINTC